MMKLHTVIFIIANLLFPLAGRASEKSFVPRMPDNLDLVEIYLHTVDLGVLVHEKYGHVQIRVHDRATGSDVAYTWGMFDYQDPGFALKFYRGIMRYKIGAYQTPVAHRIYQYDGRQVWEDRLELTAAQKQRLIEKIIQQMQPQNREYDYQYFFDNCSTRPRDFIDAAVEGRFQERYGKQITPWTFRDMVRQHQATTPLSGLGLEVTMNGRLDRPMSAWEEMFLPKALRSYLLEMPQFDDLGRPIPGSQLLTPIRTYYDAPTPTANFRQDDLITYAALGVVPLLAFGWLARLRRRTEIGQIARLPRPMVRMFGFCVILWALVSFVFGSVMITSWIFSNHLDLHHNANLWLFWPLDIVLVWIGWLLLRHGQWPIRGSRRLRFCRFLMSAHIVAGAAAGILAVFGIIEQDISRVLAVFGICGLMIYLTTLQITAPHDGMKKREQPI